jgi:CheY-like chemotaxis protein
MPVELAVWEGPQPASDAQAARTFKALYRQFMQPERNTPPTERIAAYVDALLARYPDLTELDDAAVEDSPWIDGPSIHRASGRVLFLDVVENDVGEAAWRHAVRTARSAGLVCFDPNSRARVIRVLHVDDEAPIRLLVRVNLEPEGMEVIEAANGRIGVELAKREQPDLILLGVMMPILDGWQAAEELRKDPETREIPIVFLTARNRLKDRARGFHFGAIEYIVKPFNPMDLAPCIRGLMERLERGEREELRLEKISELHALRDAGVPWDSTRLPE